MHEVEGRSFQGVEFRDVDIKTALSVPESDGIEIVVCLHTMGGSEVCYSSSSPLTPSHDSLRKLYLNELPVKASYSTMTMSVS